MNCQIRLPSAAEQERLLSNPQRITKLVDCVIKYDPASCDPRLKDAYEIAPEYFSAGGTCDACTAAELEQVKRFLQRLQKQHRTEYQRLINTVAA